MKHGNVLPILAIGLCVLGCGAEQPRTGGVSQQGLSREVALPPVDISTPDRALKSYWALEDSVAVSNAQPVPDPGGTFARNRNATLALLTGDALRETQKSSPARERESREILNVTVESESRAIILARIRNTTPVPGGVTMEDYAKKARDNGDVYRYLIERDSTGWKISQVYAQGYGSEMWTPRFTPDQPTIPWLTWP